MDINSLRPDPARRIESVPAVNDDARPPESNVEDRDHRDHGDTVEISDEARARAAKAADEIPSGTLSPERLAEVRRMIMEHAQDSDAVADETMRRVLQSGDLW